MCLCVVFIMVDWNREHVDEVSHWIENEQTCVSIGRVSDQLGLNRPTASQLLQHIAKNALLSSSSNQRYEITKCVVVETTNTKEDEEEEIPCTGKFHGTVRILMLCVQKQPPTLFLLSFFFSPPQSFNWCRRKSLGMNQRIW